MSDTVKQPETLDDIRTLLWEQYGGENKRITDADYDRTLAVKCINGIFVGRKTENIAGFGGDPSNVTIFGESAGAASCTLLPLIKRSHAYPRRVIAESGSINLTRSTEEAIECTDKLMEALGCSIVADLLKIDAEKLLETASSLLF